MRDERWNTVERQRLSKFLEKALLTLAELDKVDSDFDVEDMDGIIDRETLQLVREKSYSRVERERSLAERSLDMAVDSLQAVAKFR